MSVWEGQEVVVRSGLRVRAVVGEEVVKGMSLKGCQVAPSLCEAIEIKRS